MNPSIFKYPGPEWRGKPFWCWNGKLEKRELIRQIHIIKEMGIGGFFMHSRTGLETEYLGKEWFELINTCIREGRELGLESWLYDEDRSLFSNALKTSVTWLSGVTPAMRGKIKVT